MGLAVFGGGFACGLRALVRGFRFNGVFVAFLGLCRLVWAFIRLFVFRAFTGLFWACYRFVVGGASVRVSDGGAVPYYLKFAIPLILPYPSPNKKILLFRGVNLREGAKRYNSCGDFSLWYMRMINYALGDIDFAWGRASRVVNRKSGGA